MALTSEEVRKIASLARLRFSPADEATMAGQLGHIVDYIDQLQRWDPGRGEAASGPRAAAPPVAAGDPAVAAVTPAPAAAPASVAAGEAPEAEDRPGPCLPRESFLANAPAALDGFLLVPEVKLAGE